mmetsp:Transcript_53838/g.89356  ORF Transcript_53838/g.89356 Transcript_53838/m.89356 type:complete len:103 (+) Transcript_53838:167-475(+)
MTWMFSRILQRCSPETPGLLVLVPDVRRDSLGVQRTDIGVLATVKRRVLKLRQALPRRRSKLAERCLRRSARHMSWGSEFVRDILLHSHSSSQRMFPQLQPG